MTAAAPHRCQQLFSERTERVLAYAQGFALSHAVTPQQRRLLETALLGLRAQVGEQGVHPFVDLPLLVYAGLRGDDTPAFPLAAATSLLFLGLDIFDDIADGDLPVHWRGYRPAEINLAAATLLCALPQLALAELDAPAACRAAQPRLPRPAVAPKRTLARPRAVAARPPRPSRPR